MFVTMLCIREMIMSVQHFGMGMFVSMTFLNRIGVFVGMVHVVMFVRMNMRHCNMQMRVSMFFRRQ